MVSLCKKWAAGNKNIKALSCFVYNYLPASYIHGMNSYVWSVKYVDPMKVNWQKNLLLHKQH